MDKYGLIGYPLGHSFSKDFFHEKFGKEGIDAEYLNFEIPDIGCFPDIITGNPGLHGLNVTIPYKEQVIPFLDELSEEAHEIGAVNVVKVSRHDGSTILKGYNSDVIGFMSSIRPVLKQVHRKALILGTGGASKAVRYGLHQSGIDCTFVSRTVKTGMLTYEQLTEEIMTDHLVIVNTTPVGMYPRTEACPDIPYDMIGENHLLFDVIYNPEETLFLQKGRLRGASVKNGLEMLILQAKAAWNIWQE